MSSYIRALINLFYPKACVGCGLSLMREEEFLCVGCEMELPINPFLNEPNNEIKQVFAGRLPLKSANTFGHLAIRHCKPRSTGAAGPALLTLFSRRR